MRQADLRAAIRTVTPSGTIAAWFAREWSDYYADLDLDAIVATLLPGPDGLPVTLGAFLGDEMVGTVAIRGAWKDVPEVPAPWIGGLYVAPPFRHGGVGMQLVTAAVDHAGAMGFESAHISIRRNPSPYLEAGWELVGEAEAADGPVLVLKIAI